MEYPAVTLYGMTGVDKPTIEKGVTIGEGTRIGQNTYVGIDTQIGRDCSIMQHVTICKDAVIEDHVFIGPNTTLLNDKYPPTKISQPPILKQGCVIGGGVTILPAVIIGERAVVGAGSVVTKDVSPRTVVYGNPAVFKRCREDFYIRQQEIIERLGGY
jgi:acetyltransferase-like isoleucine patch superfamily enzyme